MKIRATLDSRKKPAGKFRNMGLFGKSDEEKAIASAKKEKIKNFKPTYKIGTYFQFDENTGEVLINNFIGYDRQFFNIKNVIGYEIIGDKETVGSFGVGRAVGGAVLTGGVGLLLGFTKKKKVVNDFRLRINVKNSGNSFYDIIGVKTQTKTNSLTFQQCQKSFAKITSFLEEKLQQQNKDSQTESATSPADELMKFKSLLDAGAITEEEFNKQKEKLLR